MIAWFPHQGNRITLLYRSGTSQYGLYFAMLRGFQGDLLKSREFQKKELAR
jgi:hypothetical protein